MKYEENLTNESLTKRFNNQFELVRYAISRARNAILSGRDPQVKSETQNLSAKVLVEIGLGIDLYEEVDSHEEEEEVKEPLPTKKEIIDFDDDDDDEEEVEVTSKGKKKSSDE